MNIAALRRKLAAGILTLAFAAALVPTVRAENQPHMKAALEALRRAKQELQQAERDKGGHREKALQATDNAIRQVQAGINYDEKHESRKEKRDRH
jgi:hypothetical protein